MSYHLRAPIVFVPAIILFSFLASVAQTNSNRDRAISANAGPVERRSGTRSVPRVAQLPFEQSVIIYYKVPAKTSSPSNPGSASASKTEPAARTAEDSQEQLTDAARSLTSQASTTSRKPLRANTAVDLQPVIIYYRTYAPAAIVRSSEPNVKQTAAAPNKRFEPGANPSPRTVPKQPGRSLAPSDAVSFGPANLAEQRQSKDVRGSAKQETAPAKLSENVNEPVPSPSQPAANKLDTETANLIVGKTVENPSAPGGATVDSPLQKAGTSQHTLANGAAASNLTSTSPSATLPEATTSDIPTVVETAKANAGSLPATTSAGLEAESGSMDAIGLNNSAVRLSIENQHDQAIALLERAIEADPTVAKFHRNLSIAFERMKQFDKALASARNAEKLAPADPSVLEQLCELELITANTNAALGCYEKLQSMAPLDAMAQTYYGLALFKSGKEEESIKILKQAALSKPPIAEAMNVLGVVYYKMKQFDNAIAILKNAVETAPDVFEMRYNLALAQLARGNKAAAISQYNMIKTGDRKLADQLFRVLQGDRVVSVSDMMRSKR